MKRLLFLLSFVLTAATASAQDILKGDANNDKTVDSKDVTVVENHILNRALNRASGNFVFQNADVNGDGSVNAADIVGILNIIIDKMSIHYNRLLLTKKDGSVEAFDFADKPVVSYSGNDLVLTTSKTSVQQPVYLIQKISFDDGGSK